MYTISVFSVPGDVGQKDIFCMQLLYNGLNQEWRPSRYHCLEYAEAEALDTWKLAATVNGLSRGE